MSDPIFHWDLILHFQTSELTNYLHLLQSKDDRATDKDAVTQRVLDARVETSVRFDFQNPIVGQHGYTHKDGVRSQNKWAQEVVLKGATALHYAVHLGNEQALNVLLEAGADASLMNERNETPFLVAKMRGDEKIMAVFQQFRPYACKLRKQFRLAVAEVEASRKSIQQFQADIGILSQVRATLMAQVVALWWRYITAMARRQNLHVDKHQIAMQLENITQMSNVTISNLEKEKRVLVDEKSALKEQVVILETNINQLEKELKQNAEKLNIAELELNDRNAMKADLNSMRSQLIASVELISSTLQQQQLITLKGDGTSGFDPERLLSELNSVKKQLAQLQVESARDKTELTACKSALDQSQINESTLRADLEVCMKRNADYKLEIAALRVAAASFPAESSFSATDISHHHEYIRLQKQLEASRKEIEKLRGTNQK